MVKKNNFSKEELDSWLILKDFHLDDIDICLANNANYAATKMMLTFIDILGGFYVGLMSDTKEGVDIKKVNYFVRAGGNRAKKSKTFKINGIDCEKSGSRTAFLSFVKNYIPELCKHKIIGRERWDLSEMLYDHFRCGMVHEGHPKLGTAIIKKHNNSIFIFNKDSDGKVLAPIALNILCLRDALRSAIFKYEEDLFEEKARNNIAIRWKDRYEYLTKRFRI